LQRIAPLAPHLSATWTKRILDAEFFQS